MADTYIVSANTEVAHGDGSSFKVVPLLLDLPLGAHGKLLMNMKGTLDCRSDPQESPTVSIVRTDGGDINTVCSTLVENFVYFPNENQAAFIKTHEIGTAKHKGGSQYSVIAKVDYVHSPTVRLWLVLRYPYAVTKVNFGYTVQISTASVLAKSKVMPKIVASRPTKNTGKKVTKKNGKKVVRSSGYASVKQRFGLRSKAELTNALTLYRKMQADRATTRASSSSKLSINAAKFAKRR